MAEGIGGLMLPGPPGLRRRGGPYDAPARGGYSAPDPQQQGIRIKPQGEMMPCCSPKAGGIQFVSMLLNLNLAGPSIL